MSQPIPRLTVGELIEKLKVVPPDLYWHGWDDESIILTSDSDGMDTVGWVEPNGDTKYEPRQPNREPDIQSTPRPA